MGLASVPVSTSSSSTGSGVPTRPGPGPPAGPGWAWPSPWRTPGCTRAGCKPGGSGEGARSSGLRCRARWAGSLSDPRCPCALTRRSPPPMAWIPWLIPLATAPSRGAAMRDPRSAVSRRPGRWTALVTGLAAAAALAGGCSFIPSGTGPQPASAPGPPSGAGPCCGLLVSGPQPGWSPEDVVKNFLLASAIRANNFRVARQYLTQAASRAWRPGTAVTILTKEPRVTPLQSRVAEANQTVTVTGQEQAILNPAGQYIPAPGGLPPENFILKNVNGLYKIDQLISSGHSKISHELLLKSDLFQLEYTPRNLYYYGLRNWKLLPYPVFVPIQGKDPPVTLIDDLINGPSGWLQGAAKSAFPPKSRVVPPIQV